MTTKQITALASGFISKMEFSIIDGPGLCKSVEYYLVVDNNRQVLLNDLLGQQITLKFSGAIRCQNCHKPTNKSYQQGYCYPCATKLARCDLCIVNPHTCHYHVGTCREPSWGEKHCFIPYIVYLANSSGIKVGVSRASNLLNRWVDQGAIQGLGIIKAASRYQAGLIEFALAKFIKDKTNWRKMLSFQVQEIDLTAVAQQLIAEHQHLIQDIINKFPAGNIELVTEVAQQNLVKIEYPNVDSEIAEVPIKSLSKLVQPQTQSMITDRLIAIKGQYLLLRGGVLNLRNLTGYHLDLIF